MPWVDTYCILCWKPIPRPESWERFGNLAYCSEPCRLEGWRRHHGGAEWPNEQPTTDNEDERGEP